MINLPTLSTEKNSAICHGGNEYNGPGAWHRPRKARRLPASILLKRPLDLTSVVGGRLDGYEYDQVHLSTSEDRQRERRAAVLHARLESLSLSLAPSHGLGGPMLERYEPKSNYAEGRKRKTKYSVKSAMPLSSADEAKHSWVLTASGAHPHNNDCTLSGPEMARGSGAADGTEQRGPDNLHAASEAKPAPGNCLRHRKPLRKSAPGRVVSSGTRTTSHDNCNSETLRARLSINQEREHQKPRDEVQRQRRHDAHYCRKVRRRPAALIGEEGQTCHSSAAQVRRGQSATRLLKLVAKEEVHMVEYRHRHSEDKEMNPHCASDDAVERKRDCSRHYATPAQQDRLVSESDYQSNVQSGFISDSKTSAAARCVQNWWWSVWPPLLRRHKRAALLVQSAFRGFVERRRWKTIIRLRMLWGHTRVVAPIFKLWRSRVAEIKRARSSARHFRNQCQAKCFKTWAKEGSAQRHRREDALQKRLRRTACGTRVRVFEAWVKFAETSSSVKRMHRRCIMISSYKAWRALASRSRRYKRAVWACASIASRVLRWRESTKYKQQRTSCIKLQRFARVRIARGRIRTGLRDRRARLAEGIVQREEDKRICDLLDVEQKRRDRLHATIDQARPLMREHATSLLNAVSVHESCLTEESPATSKGVAMGIRMFWNKTDGPRLKDTQDKEVLIRMLMEEEEWLLRHDFEARSPAKLCCPRTDCTATHVDRDHYLRHRTDAHPNIAATVWNISVILSDPDGLAVLEGFVLATRTDTECHSNTPFEISFSDDGRPSLSDLLCLWRAIVEWRGLPSSTAAFEQLTASILSQSKAFTGDDTSDREARHLEAPVSKDTGRSLSNLGILRKPIEQLETVERAAALVQLLAANVRAVETASWQLVVRLADAVGRSFLSSAVYVKYIDNLSKQKRDSVTAVAADIAARESVAWLAETREIKLAANHARQERAVSDLADRVLDGLLGEGDTFSGLLGSLIESQVRLLAAAIIAERRIFARVISAVWNEAVDLTAHLTAIEQRQVDPSIASPVSEASCTIARSLVIDELIDQTIQDLTAPEGEFWTDARAMVAIADGVVYRVRSAVIDGLLEDVLRIVCPSEDAAHVMDDATDVCDLEINAKGDLGEHAQLSPSMALLIGDLPQPQERELVSGPAAANGRTREGASNADDLGRHRALSAGLRHCHEGMVLDEPTARGEPVRGDRLSGFEPGGSAAAVSCSSSSTEIAQAAIAIQSMLRRKRAYREAKTRVARNFTKMYDPSSGHFYWYNQTTGESTWERPAIMQAFFNTRKIFTLPEYLSS